MRVRVSYPGSGVCSWQVLAVLMGYGERPAYLGGWMFALITVMALVYQKWFPFSVNPSASGFVDYWYFSLKIFCAQGFASSYFTVGLMATQVVEFALGLILIALLVGSVTRKLS